jgi:predicted tellurium resistance membrane protein TerC
MPDSIPMTVSALIAAPQSWLALLTLSLLEIVLGIDNIIFLSVLVGRLPPEARERARVTGLTLAMLTRIALLLSIVWLTGLVKPWFHFGERAISARDLVLLFGGLFLLAKSVLEIHQTFQGEDLSENGPGIAPSARFALIVTQIAVIDIVFSLDSVFTAVGLAKDLPIMIAAIVVAMLVMMQVSRSISVFIERFPTIKMLLLKSEWVNGRSDAMILPLRSLFNGKP